LPPISDSELAWSEEGHGFELGWGMMIEGLRLMVFVVVCGNAVMIGRSHIDQTGVLAGT
jgi:hypothetical protein